MAEERQRALRELGMEGGVDFSVLADAVAGGAGAAAAAASSSSASSGPAMAGAGAGAGSGSGLAAVDEGDEDEAGGADAAGALSAADLALLSSLTLSDGTLQLTTEDALLLASLQESGGLDGPLTAARLEGLSMAQAKRLIKNERKRRVRGKGHKTVKRELRGMVMQTGGVGVFTTQRPRHLGAAGFGGDGRVVQAGAGAATGRPFTRPERPYGQN